MWYMEKKRTKKFLINAVSDNEKRDLFEIEINGMKKINFMLQQFQHDYSKIAENLRIIENRMVLVNP